MSSRLVRDCQAERSPLDQSSWGEPAVFHTHVHLSSRNDNDK